jgi:hypothetical protein
MSGIIDNNIVIDVIALMLCDGFEYSVICTAVICGSN